MASIIFSNVFKRYGTKSASVTAVDNLNVAIREREFMVFVGPSGCGKTTALRMVAGLEDISDGTISIDGLIVNDVQPRHRDIAMVFQNYALYPHMSVYDNMAFALKLRGVSRGDIDRRVKNASSLLELDLYLKRKPGALSGGQRQRVALARAIVREPKLFLMDEPLSNLDAKLRVHTRAEIIKLHRTLGITTIYVTHDQVEAMTMGDRIVVMRNGTVQQCDTPLAIYNKPANTFVAGFIGMPPMNFLSASLERKSSGGYEVGLGSVKVPLDCPKNENLDRCLNKKVVAGLRPADIKYGQALSSRTKDEFINLRSIVDIVEPMGDVTTIYVTAGPHRLTAQIDGQNKIAESDTLDLAFDPSRLYLFDEVSGVSLL